MKKIRFILAAVLVLAQLPFTAFALPAVSSGPTALSAEVLNSVSGGACSSCHTTPAPEPEEPRHPSRLGNPYWEHTRTRQVGYSDPGGQLAYHYVNSTYSAVTKSFNATVTEAFNWSVGGGVPGSVISASLDSSYSKSESTTFNVYIPSRTNYKYFISHPTTRYHYTFTRYQDWSDGSRQALTSGVVPGSRISIKANVITSPL